MCRLIAIDCRLEFRSKVVGILWCNICVLRNICSGYLAALLIVDFLTLLRAEAKVSYPTLKILKFDVLGKLKQNINYLSFKKVF